MCNTTERLSGMLDSAMTDIAGLMAVASGKAKVYNLATGDHTFEYKGQVCRVDSLGDLEDTETGEYIEDDETGRIVEWIDVRDGGVEDSENIVDDDSLVEFLSTYVLQLTAEGGRKTALLTCGGPHIEVVRDWEGTRLEGYWSEHQSLDDVDGNLSHFMDYMFDF